MAAGSYALLAPVVDGWTGAVTVTVGATVATVTPRARTSALAVLERVVYEARRVHGAAFVAYTTAAGEFTVEMPATFAIAATGTTATKTGLTATQSGADAYTFPDAVVGGIVPAYGARVRSRTAGRDTGAALLAGGLGFTRGIQKSAGSLALFDTLANSSTMADTLAAGGTYDLAVLRTDNATNITALARLRVAGSSVQRWTELGSSGRVECSVLGVSA